MAFFSSCCFRPRGAQGLQDASQSLAIAQPTPQYTAISAAPAGEVVGIPPPLLRLPPHLRHHIYFFVGPESWRGFGFTFFLQGRDPNLRETSKTELAADYSRAFRGLLFSCRVIYAEVAGLIYSSNHFVIHYRGPGSLSPLHALTPTTLSSLRSLKIVLNETSCHQRAESQRDLDCCIPPNSLGECYMPWEPPSHDHQSPLLATRRSARSHGHFVAAQGLLSEWHAAARHLSAFVTPGNLELGLVCDIDPQHERAVEVAASVVAPLRLLPRLWDCHVRLARRPDPRLSEIAQRSALDARGVVLSEPKPSPAKPSFLALPRELRLRILGLTDLVTPNREVWWCRQDAKYAWADRLVTFGFNCQDFKPGCSFAECWYRTRSARGRGLPGMPFGCFCRRRHAASSPACSCWLPPSALFVVCRVMCQDAQFVFFSANRFIVYDLTSRPFDLDPQRFKPAFAEQCADLSSGYPFPRLAASHFLREAVPTHCVAYLRFLELVFPPYLAATWPRYDHPAMQDWRETVRWLKDKVNGPALTLRVAAAQAITYGPEYRDAVWISIADGDTIEKGNMTILHPLAELAKGPNGLARFYANLRFPWEWTDRAMTYAERRRRVEAGKKSLKKRAECLVLGDRYNSQYADGKEEPDMSLWQHTFVRHC